MAARNTIRGWPHSSDETAPSEARPPGGEVVDGKIDFGAFALEQGPEGATPEPTDSGIFTLSTGLLFADRYRLMGRIARGGMGSVWSATDERLGRSVAVKFMSPELADDEEYRHRFEQEGRAAAKLVSQHVVGIHDHGVTNGIPFIVMELLEGEDLHRRLRAITRFPLEVCDRLFTQSARGLRAAHEAGIVHRDIKPQNLFLARQPDDDEDVVKLLDFGVAKHAGTDGLHTKTGVLVGSPHFMSPEQIRGQRNIDHRSDLFSLAAVMYRCVTGARPYEGDMPVVMLKITREPPTPPSTVLPELPRELDGFFARALALKPEDRFQSAMDMARAFHAIVAAHVPEGGVVSPTPRLARETTLRFSADAPVAGPARPAHPSEHPTIVGEVEDVLGPPSIRAAASTASTSDAPTQVVHANQVPGLDAALRAPGLPSPAIGPGSTDDPSRVILHDPGPSDLSSWGRSSVPDQASWGRGSAPDPASWSHGSEPQLSPWHRHQARPASRSLADIALDEEAALLGRRSGRAPFVVVGILAAILLVLIAILLLTG